MAKRVSLVALKSRARKDPDRHLNRLLDELERRGQWRALIEWTWHEIARLLVEEAERSSRIRGLEARQAFAFDKLPGLRITRSLSPAEDAMALRGAERFLLPWEFARERFLRQLKVCEQIDREPKNKRNEARLRSAERRLHKLGLTACALYDKAKQGYVVGVWVEEVLSKGRAALEEEARRLAASLCG